MTQTMTHDTVTADRNGSALRCVDLRKRFGATVAVDGLDLTVPRGELLALLGPSGCGKTTTLRMIAGLERPDTGDIWIHGRHVDGAGSVPPERRRVGFVFQDLALFPHLDVWGNIAFGLGGAPAERVEEMITLARLQGLERRMPHELSGGQQQRVALARCLVPGPDLVLLDEPFSNLDRMLRAAVRAEVRELLRAAGVTSVFVTHDNEEALSIADHVAVMLDGRIRQVGTPSSVYAHPVDGEVAELVGEMNLLPGSVRDRRASTAFAEVAASLPDGPCYVLIRPEDIGIDPDPAGPAVVVDVEYYGHDELIRCSIGPSEQEVMVRVVGTGPRLVPGDRVRLRLVGAARALPA
ncbi:MAG TPA: ABC transporter ATP-binding protein [Actinomycetota bacterium]